MKKQFYYFLICSFFLLIPLANLQGQAASTCANSSQIMPTNTETYVDYSMSTSERWFNFTATNADAVFSIDQPTLASDTPDAHIRKIELFSGNCANLVPIAADSIHNHGSDSLPVLRYTSLTIGATYLIRVTTFVELITCRKCVPTSPVYFSLNIQNLIQPAVVPSCSGFCGANIAFQGDFEQPAYSPHALQPPAGSNMIWVSAFGQNASDYTKQYCVANTSPNPFQLLGQGQDHTAGNGNYYYYGDAPSEGCSGCNSPWTATAWASTAPVIDGRIYCFSAWFKNIGGGATFPAEFQMEVDGNILVAYTTVAGTNQWVQLSGTWTASYNGNAQLAIQCKGKKTIEACDFGLDDIEFRGNVLDPPTITASSSVFCVGQPVTLTATGGDTYQWYDSNGNNLGTNASIVVTPTTTTTYIVNNLTAPGCEANSASITLTPSVVIPQIGIISNTCMGNQITFNNISIINGLSPVLYSWNFGDGGTATTTNAIHTYINPGTYTVILTATDPCGNVTTTITIIDILPSTSNYNVACCSENQTYTHTGKIFVTNPISNPEVWSGQSYTVKGTIYIFAGAELDIVNNSTIQFDPLSKIVVLPGGVLKVDHATLTGLNTCGTMWQGIEVQGDKTKTQTQLQQNGNLYQGKAILNFATVSLAHNGVVLGAQNTQTNGYDPNKSGGILQATNAVFLNCGYSVRFITYPFVNSSRITNCAFNSTTLPDPGYLTGNGYTYPNAANPLYAYANTGQRAYTFVHTFGVKWVQMTGSTLTNAEYGVVGINSALRIGGTGLGQENSFTNIPNSEIHSNIFNSPFYANRVVNNEYTNSLIPIQSWNGVGDQIRGNRIRSAFVGIGTVGSGNIYITDNLLGIGTGSCLIGVSTSNSGTMGGLIGRVSSGNIFTRCANSTWLQTNNANLQVHCNQHFNTSNYVSNLRNFGSLANQGYLPILTDKDPAGNIFNQTTPLRNQIQSNTLFFDYYAHFADQFNVSVTVVPQPTGILTPANIQVTGFQMTPTSCDPAPPCTNCGNQIAALNTQIDQLQTEKTSIQSQLDHGQTQMLLDAINSNMNSGQLKNLLLANSPLSDQVLLAYIAKNGTPPGTFKDVLIPNSPVSKAVRPALYAKIETMPNGIKNQVIEAQANYQNRTLSVVDDELQSVTGKRQELYNQQMSFYIDQSETDPNANAAIKNQLTIQNTEASKEALASTYLAEENYPAAAATINSLNPQNAEAQAEKDLLLLLLNIYSGGRDIYQMTAPEEQAVRATAALPTECLARSNARVILFAAFGEALDLDLQMNGARAGDPELETAIEPSNQVFFGESYPNPAGDQVTMQCRLPEGNSGTLTIFDVNGKLIYSQSVNAGQQIITIDTQIWTNGIYFCSLEANGIRIGTQKILIAKE
jgi:PKD domain/Secretion system C-terminal sorting domain